MNITQRDRDLGALLFVWAARTIRADIARAG
jgi:hypothetical protein